MPWVPQALEWVRALLFGPRKPDTPTHADQHQQAPVYAVQPSPEVWGAMLALARLRRTGHASAPQDDRHAQGDAHPLVRAYVLPPEERQHTLSAWKLTEASR